MRSGRGDRRGETSMRSHRPTHGWTSDGALQTFKNTRFWWRVHIWPEDRTGPRSEQLSKWQLCDYSFQNPAIQKHWWELCNTTITILRQNFCSTQDHHKSQKPHAHYSSNGTEDPVQPQMEPARWNTMRPYMEQLGEPFVRDNKDQAQSSCIDFQVQEEPDQSTGRRRKKALAINSRWWYIFWSLQNKNHLMAELFPKDDKVCQEISQDAKDIDKEHGNLEAHESLMISDTAQRKSCTTTQTPGHTRCKCGLIPSWSEPRSQETSSQERHGFFQ